MSELPKTQEQLKQDLLDIDEEIWNLQDLIFVKRLGKAAIQNALKDKNYIKE